MATAKEIREDIARSRAYAKKNNYLKTLSCLANAIRGLVTSQVFGAEKFEIQSHLVEALRDLNKMKMIQKLFPAGLKYQKGKEKAFYQTLDRLHKKLAEAMEKARLDRQRKRLAVLDGNLIKAAQLIKAGTPIEARTLYAKISEYFVDIDGINSDIGNRMVTMGLFQEAVPYLRKALDVQNTDARAHNALILAFEGMHETEQAIGAIKDAMRWLGPSENLYLRAAKLQLALSDWGEVYNNAKAAHDRNPLNTEAAKLMKQAEPKIFTGSGSRGSGGRAAKSHNLDF
ncbi:MAG: hypothetical protein H0S80_11770 [Desulfovibrionaceae bacterium]|nr:hypothetical protein [Desulfovibrionaceae bacterium]